MFLGRLFLELRRWEEAESALKLSYSYNPNDPRVYFYLSRLSEQRLIDFSYSNKKALLERAIYLSPGYEAARVSLAKIKLTGLYYKYPEEVMNEGLRINPKSIPLLLNLSALQLETARPDQATETCYRILSLDSLNAAAMYNLGLAHLHQELFKDAVDWFKKSHTQGGSVENLFYIGVSYERSGDLKEALRWYQRRAANPSSSDDIFVRSAREKIRRLQYALSLGDSLTKN